MKIGIVNDSAIAVEALRRIVRPSHAVVWVARDGREAVEACRRDTPDLVLMDLRMPVMGGVECTRRIMAESPCPILIVTATVDGNVSDVYDALGAGALDAVDTPILGRGGEMGGEAAFLAKLETIARLTGHRARPATAPPASRSGREPSLPTLVVIGSSTGGPAALAAILSEVSPASGAAIVIVQHLDCALAPGLATWLTGRTSFPTEVIAEGAVPRAGVALVAATDDHLAMTPGRRLTYTAHPRRLSFRPSVDVFFESVAKNWPNASIAALLTGMGSDGARGLLALRAAGWTTLAQDEASCVVYGMPRAAAEIDAAREILALDAIGPRLASLVERGGGATGRARPPRG